MYVNYYRGPMNHFHMSDEQMVDLFARIDADAAANGGFVALCKKNGITTNFYYYHKRKLAEKQCAAIAANDPVVNENFSDMDELKKENERLKILLADTMLNMQILRAA